MAEGLETGETFVERLPHWAWEHKAIPCVVLFDVTPPPIDDASTQPLLTAQVADVVDVKPTEFGLGLNGGWICDAFNSRTERSGNIRAEFLCTEEQFDANTMLYMGQWYFGATRESSITQRLALARRESKGSNGENSVQIGDFIVIDCPKLPEKEEKDEKKAPKTGKQYDRFRMIIVTSNELKGTAFTIAQGDDYLYRAAGAGVIVEPCKTLFDLVKTISVNGVTPTRPMAITADPMEMAAVVPPPFPIVSPLHDANARTYRRRTELLFKSLRSAANAAMTEAARAEMITTRRSVDANNPKLPLKFILDFKQISFRENHCVGEGNFGKVYKGTYVPSAEGDIQKKPVRVAIKKLFVTKATAHNNPWISEVAQLAKLDHPNVMKFYGVAFDGDKEALTNGDYRLYIVGELVDGGDLYDMMQRQRKTDMSHTPVRFELHIKMDILYQIASALTYLHSKDVIHRDLATRNILLTNMRQLATDPHRWWSVDVKLCDFGLARSLDIATDAVVEGETELPWKWMAPEAILGRHSKASDVWSWAVCAWELLHDGGMPFGMGIETSQLVDILKEGVRLETDHSTKGNELICRLFSLLLAKCWHFQPKDRPSAGHVLRRLAKLLDQKQSKKPG